MATVTGFTAERMLEIENSTVVGGEVNGEGELILITRDDTEINAGGVIGPMGPVGSADPGDICTSIRTAKTGWLLMGTSVPNANTAHAALWAQVPASWQSGTTLNLPAGDYVLQSGGVLGALDHANSRAISEANLPPHVHTGPAHTHTGPTHTHTMNHDHPAGTTGNQSVNHTHTFTDTATTGGQSVTHQHGINLTLVAQFGGGNLGLQSGGAGQPLNLTGSPSTGSASVTHTHTVTVSGTTSANNASHNHSFNVPAYTGSTGAATAGNTGSSGTANTGPGNGTSVAFNVQQLALRVNYFIKT